jgi:diketogulonate reductase-like aldo/keto reductase
MKSYYGDNEKLLAEWFQKSGKRDQIFLASKFGYVRGSTALGIDSSAEYCKKACDATLKALGVDYIDLCKASFLLSGHLTREIPADPVWTRLCTQRRYCDAH